MDQNVFSSRKIITGAILLIIAIGCVHWRGDIPPNMLNFMEVLFGFFVGGNSVEHVSTLFKSYLENKGNVDVK